MSSATTTATAPTYQGRAATMSSLGRILRYMVGGYPIQCVIVLVCILASAWTTTNATVFMQTLIDTYTLPLLGQENPDFGPLAVALGHLALVCSLGVILTYAYSRIMVTVSQGTMRHLREELFDHMESLPIRYFDSNAHGDIMSVYTNDVDTLRQLMSMSIPQIVNSCAQIVTNFVAMIVLDVPLTVVSVVMMLAMLWAAKDLGGKSARYFSAQQADLGRVDGYIEEMMAGQKVVKVFCHEREAIASMHEVNDQLRQSSTSANAYSNILMPTTANLANISYVLVAVIGGAFALFGFSGLTLGGLVSFLTLNRSFSQPVTQVSQQLNAVVMAAAGGERIFRLLDEEPEGDEGYVELVNVERGADGELHETERRTGTWAWRHPHAADGSVTYTPLTGDIEFENVDFGYVPGKTVLHGINLQARAGQKVAFVGSTGAGKTTITNLINRFYDISGGKIRYDGINVSKIRKPDLRRSLGIVLQDTHLFTGTVMDNIRYGRLDATDEECREAARLANADGFIRRLPQGYDTQISGDGGNLSQGQRQLIAIARAAVADPPVLILDEATSSIDTHTEALVQQGMDALMRGRTSFVIAHRLSTVRDADQICVLELGRIVERGTHDELIAAQGRYWQLYTGGKVTE